MNHRDESEKMQKFIDFLTNEVEEPCQQLLMKIYLREIFPHDEKKQTVHLESFIQKGSHSREKK
jgi:hypothetical protein